MSERTAVYRLYDAGGELLYVVDSIISSAEREQG